jgi:hypothetical protein
VQGRRRRKKKARNKQMMKNIRDKHPLHFCCIIDGFLFSFFSFQHLN